MTRLATVLLTRYDPTFLLELDGPCEPGEEVYLPLEDEVVVVREVTPDGTAWATRKGDDE